MKNKSTVLRIISYLKAYRLELFFTIVFTIFSSILQILSPKLMGNITTKVFENVQANMPVEIRI